MLTIAKIRDAENNIKPHVIETPLVYSDSLSKKTNHNVYLKLESQQYTSSFKPRPAFNSILTNLKDAKEKGVLTSSSGNFAQAVAFASQKLGVSVQIVMMRAASHYKKTRTKSFGAHIIECGNSFEERVQTLKRAHEETDRVLLHQYDTYETMAGDATVATEILRQFSEDFAVICCTSGGGLTAGVGFATKELRPTCKVYGVLPHTHAWPIQNSENPNTEPTIADALVPAKAGNHTYPIVQKYVDDMTYATNPEIREAMRALCFEQRLMVEPGGAASVAALLANKFSNLNSNVICIISGANIDFPDFVKLIS